MHNIFKFKKTGFTLIELLLVMAIFAIIASFSVINLVKPQISSALNSTTTTLISDLKEQQIKSMVGDSEGTASSQRHGIRFETDRYILYRGNYSPSESSNFTVNLDPSLRFSSLPSGQEVTFAKRSGETTVANLTLQHIQSGNLKNISINYLGSVVIN